MKKPQKQKEQEEQVEEDPLLVRKSATETWLLGESGDYVIFRIEEVKRFHKVLRKWIVEDKTESYIKPSERGYLKAVQFKILITRDSVHPTTLKPIQGYFVREVRGEIPQWKGTKHWFLKISPSQYWRKKFRAGGVVFCQNLVSQTLALDDETYFVTVSEVRVSKEKAIEVMKNAEILAIFSEDHTGKLTVCTSFVKI